MLEDLFDGAVEVVFAVDQAGVGLRVEVDEQGSPAGACQAVGEIDGDGGLADTAFLVEEGYLHGGDSLCEGRVCREWKGRLPAVSMGAAAKARHPCPACGRRM